MLVLPLSVPVPDRLALLRGLALEGARDSAVREVARVELGGAPWWARLLRRVQGLPGRRDPVDRDVYLPAAEVLRVGGDCADRCALLCALFVAARSWSSAARSDRCALRWDHCGPLSARCAYDHVRVRLYRPGRPVVELDALGGGPGDRVVPWAARLHWDGQVM